MFTKYLAVILGRRRKGVVKEDKGKGPAGNPQGEGSSSDGDNSGRISDAGASAKSPVSYTSSLCEPGRYRPYDTEVEFLKELARTVGRRSLEIQMLPGLLDTKDSPGRALKELKENMRELDREVKQLQCDISTWRADPKNWTFDEERLPKLEEILQIVKRDVTKLPDAEALGEDINTLAQPKLQPKRKRKFKAQILQLSDIINGAGKSSQSFRIKLVITTLTARSALATSRKTSLQTVPTARPTTVSRHSSGEIVAQRAALGIRPPAIRFSPSSGMDRTASDRNRALRQRSPAPGAESRALGRKGAQRRPLQRVSRDTLNRARQSMLCHEQNFAEPARLQAILCKPLPQQLEVDI